MKINKIAALCKEAGAIRVLLTKNGPWIGTGSAIYFVPELAGISEEGIYAVFNIPEKKREDILIHYLSEEDVDTLDINEAVRDYHTEPLKLKLEFGEEIKSLLSEDGELLMFLSAYAKPLPPDCEFYKRDNYIYVKRGFELKAIITPLRWKSEKLLTELEYVTEYIRRLIEDKDSNYEEDSENE